MQEVRGSDGKMMKTCFLIGHRDAPVALLEKLEKAIAAAIAEYGVTEFVVGQYGAFDKMAASCLAEVKKTYPEIRLVLLLPYHPSERAVVLPVGFDGSFYPPGMEAVPRRLAIVRANEYMAKHCDLLIGYAVLQNSNPGRIIRKACPGCTVINLAGKESTG
jgi:hypothetical protein